MIKMTLGMAILAVFVSQLAAAQDPSLPHSSASSEAPLPDDPNQFHLFVLAGQSNMAGRGKVEPIDTELDPRVLMLDKAKRWVPARDPLHFDKPSVVGVGVGRTFAIAYADAHPGVTVGLVPTAVGGSPIIAWQPGGYHDQTQTHPWDDCQSRMQQAMKSGVIKGVLWHQGESDANQESAPKYEARLHALIERFRTTVGDPKLPFIAGQLGQFEDRPWDEFRHQIDAAHRALPEQLSNCGFVSSTGLKHRGDNVHFDAASLREFGRRYYQSYVSLTTNDSR